MMASQHDVIIPNEGIGAAEECVEGNELVKGATMGFQKFSYKQPYSDD